MLAYSFVRRFVAAKEAMLYNVCVEVSRLGVKGVKVGCVYDLGIGKVDRRRVGRRRFIES